MWWVRDVQQAVGTTVQAFLKSILDAITWHPREGVRAPTRTHTRALSLS